MTKEEAQEGAKKLSQKYPYLEFYHRRLLGIDFISVHGVGCLYHFDKLINKNQINTFKSLSIKHNGTY